MYPTVPSLLELQRAFRSSLVLHDDSGVAAHVLDAGIDASERVDIYRNTFVSVVTNALRLSYPAVHRLVGEEFFEGAARMFIEASPPANACLDDYGAGFVDFLSAFEPAAPLSYLPDVARLEWAVTRALHAPDARALDLRRLASLSEAERRRVRFEPHPSVSLLRIAFPADQIWRAVLAKDDAALAAIDPGAAAAWLLVERRIGGIEVGRLSESTWRFTSALCRGVPLYEALLEVRDFETSAMLATHLAAGRFVGFKLDAHPNNEATP